MPMNYVEEITTKYFMKKGYLVNQNIWFQLSKEKTGKKVAGWTDIDIFALKPGEAIVVQCKSFIGTSNSKKMAKDIISWFDHALEFLQNDETYKHWIQRTKTKKVLVVDFTVKKTEELLKDTGIQIYYYTSILKELLRILEEQRTGKEGDMTLRLLSAMVEKNIIDKKVFEKET